MESRREFLQNQNRGPAGVDTGTRLRSRGNGEAGPRGGHQATLHVFMHVKPHEIF